MSTVVDISAPRVKMWINIRVPGNMAQTGTVSIENCQYKSCNVCFVWLTDARVPQAIMVHAARCWSTVSMETAGSGWSRYLAVRMDPPVWRWSPGKVTDSSSTTVPCWPRTPRISSLWSWRVATRCCAWTWARANCHWPWMDETNKTRKLWNPSTTASGTL